jgi:CheY-like chemotaxis protein
MHSVLLVDDAGLFDEWKDSVSRRTHCRVLSASTGAEALAVARGEKPELIFVNAALTGMTGTDVCRVFKADPRLARTPVVLVAHDEAQREEGRRVGADAVLTQPLDEASFFDALRRFLQIFPRNAERAPVKWEVTFWRDGIQHTGTIRDLSRGGFYVRTGTRQPIGARLEVSFDIPGERPGKTVVAEAIVVRVGQDPDRGLGCRFFRLTESSRSHLEECLRLLSLAGGTFPARA